MNDLTAYGDRELCLVICNDEYLEKQYRKCIRTGSLEYLRDDLKNLNYTDAQWIEFIQMFEDELESRSSKHKYAGE